MFKLIKKLLSPGNFDSNDIQNYNPDGDIWNEKPDSATRGKWDMPEGGERVNLSFTIRNRTNTTIYLELFNAERTVSKRDNPGLYSKNPTTRQYKPHSDFRTLYEIGLASDAALAGTAITVTADPVCTVDSFGNYLFISDRTYARMEATYVNVSANGLDATGTQDIDIPDAYIVCNELPYASLLDDMNSGLLIDLNQLRVQASQTSFFGGTIEVQRWQSFGGDAKNPLPWSIGRDPKNNLTDTIDINKVVVVDKKTSFNLRMPASCQVDMTVFGTAYRNNAIEW
jgi:hypothetical protein